MSECAARGSRPRAIKTTYTCTKCGFKIETTEEKLFKQKKNHHRRYHQGRATSPLPSYGGGNIDATPATKGV